MPSDDDPQARREAFQRDQLRERLRAASDARQENYRRQDEREQRRREDQNRRETSRRTDREADRSQSQDFSREMADQRRADKVADESARFAYGLEEQQEVTRREELMGRLGAVLYKQKLQDDYEHDARTRDLDIQEHTHRSNIDTRRITTIDDNSARNTRREIREHLKSSLYEKLADHLLSEAAKRSAHAQELERMDAESYHEVTKIREESAAKEREIRTEWDAKKDFERFMHDLRNETRDMGVEEIAGILRTMKDVT